MRRLLFLVLGLLELACAVVLVVFAWQLPASADVLTAADRVEKVSRKAGLQVRRLQEDCRILRQRQPELLALATRLEKQMRLVRDNVRDKSLNTDGLATVTEALGQVADGLDTFSTTLDPKGVATIGKGLGATASYLDEKVIPSASKAATALDKATAGLKADTGKLSKLLDDQPIELKAARAVVESLTKFEEGLQRISKLAQVETFEQMRDGMKGMETTLASGADQVEKMAKLKVPQMSFSSWMPSVKEKDFWPDAKTTADGMRKAAKGCQAAVKEMEAFNKELPRFRASLEQSQKVVSGTRKALAEAVRREQQLEPVLERLPRNLAKLADELPQLTGELATILRETAKLKDVAVTLREAEKGIELASKRWPELKASLSKSADLLRATRKQLQGAVANRDDYEGMLQQAVQLTTMFAEALPVLIHQLQTGLSQQEDSLGDLGDSIDQVSETIPPTARSASRILVTIRLLLALVALMVVLHAAYVLTTVPAARTP